MDMLQMTFPPASFTVVLDKCTMDALTTCEGSPWSPNPSTRSAVHSLLSSTSSLLPPGGRYIQVSFTQPHFRLRYLQRRSYHWTVTTEQLGDGPTSVFIYTAVKGSPDADPASFEDSTWSDTEADDADGKGEELSSDDEDVLTRIALGDDG